MKDPIGPLSKFPEIVSSGNNEHGPFRRILGHLRKAQSSSKLPNPELWLVHESILLYCQGKSRRANLLNLLGDLCLHSYKVFQFGDVDALNQAVCVYKDALRYAPGHDVYVADLGTSLLMRYERLGRLEDINEAIASFEQFLALVQPNDPNKILGLQKLGISLIWRFKHLGAQSDLNDSVQWFENAIALAPEGHPERAAASDNLGMSLLKRFGACGEMHDLDQAVLWGETAVNLSQDGDTYKLFRLNNLGISLLTCYEQLGNLHDLDQSVMRIEAAAALTSDNDPEKPSRLSNLGNSLLARFQQLEDVNDLHQSIFMKERAIALTQEGNPSLPTFLDNLGNSLYASYEKFGNINDLTNSIIKLEAAIALTPETHTHRAAMLHNLGNYLLARYEALGDQHDIDDAIERKSAAIALTPDGAPDKAAMLNNFGSSVLARFDQFGSIADLNESIRIKEASIVLTPDGHPDKPSRLNNLGNALLARYEQVGDLRDLHEAVKQQEAAVHLIAEHDYSKSAVSALLQDNLGNAFLRRFQRLRDPSDLDRSVLAKEVAVSLTPDGHPKKPSRLTNMGVSLRIRYEELKNIPDLDRSVEQLAAAVALTPESHPDRPSRLDALGSSLFRRYEHLNSLDDLDTAIQNMQSAVTLIPETHPKRPIFLLNLGIPLLNRFQKLHDPEDSVQLICYFTSAACSATGPACIRFQAAQYWAGHAHALHHPSLLHAYGTAIQLLPELAWLGLTISDRHHLLSQAGQVVRDAAAAAISAHKYQMAIEWLDQGRSIIWSQLLNLRSPVEELREKYSTLADELETLSALLDRMSNPSHVSRETMKPPTLQFTAEKAHEIALRRNHILEKIRGLEGFEGFFSPKKISELSQAATKGPIAILNVSQYGCDALILQPEVPDLVIYVPLQQLTMTRVEQLAKQLVTIVGGPGRNDRLGGSREGHLDPDAQFCEILLELWLKIVCPVLDVLKNHSPKPSPERGLAHVWWCPTGPLAFLPIHAAGMYGPDEPFDHLISSYTPSLSALIQSLRSQSSPSKDLQLLAVTQPTAENQDYIPGTKDEVRNIKQQVNGKTSVLWLNEEMATIQNVETGIQESRWVHFACHGVQSASNPTDSALLLAGSSRLTLSDIIKLSLPNADLAFLSACQTATGSQELQDESVHLAAGMMLAGYRGVIGTMWSIRDQDAPQVAADVYSHLFKISPPESTKAAEALHLAVRKLQEKLGANNSFRRWVPFIHFGV
ncbi:CHAT domain-containing protein [Roridomyces roridus]|uniref:CHAT domain-containing protein n=1 Tax=Roridomyces roridus TaxID=1738132 RepID=A0AAD7C902_9AGAR|nr:CHAT domain-containing protein [Roridomyces roridus]